ncbi:MAG: hypothetical protein ABL957_10905 [Parvularculaceae bacterium]
MSEQIFCLDVVITEICWKSCAKETQIRGKEYLAAFACEQWQFGNFERLGDGACFMSLSTQLERNSKRVLWFAEFDHPTVGIVLLKIGVQSQKADEGVLEKLARLSGHFVGGMLGTAS